MANIEFEDFVTGLTEETTPDNAADFLVIVDTSGSDVNKVKPSNILGADLTAIKALTPSNDDVLQRKAGAWTNRTIAQLTADLAITPNATHTGEVTGSGALTVDKTAITNKTGVSAAVGDSVLISDASDSDNLKKATIQSIVDLTSPNATHTGEVTGATALTVDKTAITNKTGVSAAVGDSVLISDASDSDNLKKATIQSIVDLAGGGGVAIGDTVTSATAGSVFFAGAAGILAQSNTKLFWDDTPATLRIGDTGASNVIRIGQMTSPADNYTGISLNNVTHGTGGCQLWGNATQTVLSGATEVALRIGGVTEYAQYDATTFQFRAVSATRVPTTINLAAAQTADALQVKNSSAAEVFVVNAAGSPGIKVNAAPADGDIDASQLFWWFDSTNGAAKAKFKGKSANGTVVSGEVALA